MLNSIVLFPFFLLVSAQFDSDQSLFRRAGLPPNVDVNEEPPAEGGDVSNHSHVASSHETGSNPVIANQKAKVRMSSEHL
ncbi:uncharacterized protein FA14DRAFT_18713 [Meira miltonrushii]|uniref:Uncharacterized protein n=1 Tax=Meira miltonrushii TaxID=1280837 RepID=A0A316VKI4_9BASI|nr:uncharacterized protein FA14DRAFT_18713 [Meira miltonrushii]PWN37754.1 hypothetical protein FA14DRAFT_18713 [Meira miltonrushii]